ncbi:hypothetical protein [Aliarcobacter butzleri]|uniref:hypothetical protein n=1 Tax=Aliarcobacter butzleri TaxID=28197 RepID=UPI001EDBCEA5|nr:hypothetical protein [Aliarcobacter butzleri]MCG3684359.1 hypothetical protein [Aliarcobacter butzleri]
MIILKADLVKVDRYSDKIWKYVHEQFERIIKKDGLKATKKSDGTIKRQAIQLTQNEIDFLKLLNNEDSIKELLKADVENLKKIIVDFETKFPNLKDTSNNLNRIFYNIFISNIYENHKRFDGLKFVQSIGLNTCPYCNRAYIYSIKENGIIRPEIDHFYPKAFYPYLGLSFYNLIPSCSVCNGTTAKGNKDSFKDNLKNPYEITKDDFEFKLDVISPNKFDIALNKKIDSNNTYFKLEEFYKYHDDIAYELYIKFKQENTKEYFDSLKKSLSGIGFDEDEIYRFLSGGYFKDEDLHKRPLSKLMKDISEELKLI